MKKELLKIRTQSTHIKSYDLTLVEFLTKAKTMRFRLFILIITLICFDYSSKCQTIYPGADEKTPSRAQYFSWINNTNEGATEYQTMANLEFFGWLKEEFGMQLDIYAFDAGAIDGKRFYGSIYSDRFARQFPNGFDPIYKKAKEIGIRLGVWGGPDGFGNTDQEEQARIDQMVKLCKDYDFALFKFDAVCGPLRPEKEDAFIEMMTKCREYSPDLILLNHRLGLDKAKAYATTFLWEGWETYIDVFMNNSMTAPHHRGQAISRGLVPDLQRLTEDHGTCLSSCLDYWDDDLVLQAFNRNLILAPEVYGNPWLLRDDEFAKFARIYNLHKKYREIMVEGLVLSEEKYGPYAVSRGDSKTRIVTLRNLSWEKTEYTLTPGEELGLEASGQYEVRQFHPTERILGSIKAGKDLTVQVDPFRSCLIVISSVPTDEPAIKGVDYQVIRNTEDQDVEIEILGWPGMTNTVQLVDAKKYQSMEIEGSKMPGLLKGAKLRFKFDGVPYTKELTRVVGNFNKLANPELVDWKPLYEATVFSADNNALEVRSIQRSGWSNIPEVRSAQEAFFNQKTFVDRGIWDKNLFDGSMETGFWQSKKYNRDQAIHGGCFRLDFGEVTEIDQLVIKTGDIFSLQPYLEDEGNYVEISEDLIHWEQLTFLAGTTMTIDLPGRTRYLRFKSFPSKISEIEGYFKGEKLNSENWHASNLFAYPDDRKLTCHQIWKSSFTLDEIAKNSYLCVALNGVHGTEGAYVAAKIDGKLVGAPDRAQSYQSNTWEFVNSRTNRNYTYYIPLDGSELGKDIEVYIIGFEENFEDFNPEVWIHSYPLPFEKVKISLKRK